MFTLFVFIILMLFMSVVGLLLFSLLRVAAREDDQMERLFQESLKSSAPFASEAGKPAAEGRAKAVGAGPRKLYVLKEPSRPWHGPLLKSSEREMSFRVPRRL